MLSWFKKSKPSYESILAQLADDIANREAGLYDLALRQQRTTLLWTSYASTAYLFYAVTWYFGWFASEDEVQEILKGALLIVVPALIYAVRHGIIALYARKRHRQESHLKTLRAQQKEQVDKIKKQTKYDETRTLLEKYTDEPPNTPTSTPFQQRTARMGPRHSAAANMMPALNLAGGATPVASPRAGPHNQTPSQNNPNALPGQRGWVDRFADALLGENEQSPASKYALICSQCHSHNGLVLREELATTQYICPKCGHLNQPKNVPSSLLTDSKSNQITRKLSSSVSTPNFQSKDLAPASSVEDPVGAARESSVEEMGDHPQEMTEKPQARRRNNVNKAGKKNTTHAAKSIEEEDE